MEVRSSTDAEKQSAKQRILDFIESHASYNVGELEAAASVALDKREEEAITDYQQGGHLTINGILRGNLDPETPEHLVTSRRMQIPLIEAVIGRTRGVPQEAYVFRGEVTDEKTPAHKEGETYIDMGFVSTSIKLDLALLYLQMDRPMTLKFIKLPRGTKGFMTNKKMNIEYELILQRNLKFKVVKSETIGYFTIQEIEVLL